MDQTFLVETSARHVHLSAADLEALFGKGASLTKKRELSQPGQYACEERVDVVGPKKTIPNVIVLGPTRNATQVEVSISDTRTLGVTAPIRESGDLSGSAPCKLVGPCGEVELTEGLIVAKRHIHTTPGDAQLMGLKDREIVNVLIETPDRTLTFGDVVVRVSDAFHTAMHLDTDEANAAGAGPDTRGKVVR